jgi:hypothetical protein
MRHGRPSMHLRRNESGESLCHATATLIANDLAVPPRPNRPDSRRQALKPVRLATRTRVFSAEIFERINAQRSSGTPGRRAARTLSRRPCGGRGPARPGVRDAGPCVRGARWDGPLPAQGRRVRGGAAWGLSSLPGDGLWGEVAWGLSSVPGDGLGRRPPHGRGSFRLRCFGSSALGGCPDRPAGVRPAPFPVAPA